MSDLIPAGSSWIDLIEPVGQLSGLISQTEFVPKSMRGRTSVVAACIMHGAEIGLGPMQSLAGIDVIEGRPQASAELMRALIFRAGHTLTYKTMTETRCIVQGKRAGSDEITEVAFTLDDAKRAGLAGRGSWTKYPRQMLIARATSEIARILFPDVIGGLTADDRPDLENQAPDAPPTVERPRVERLTRVRLDPERIVDQSTGEIVPTEQPKALEPAPLPEILDAEIIAPDEPAGPGEATVTPIDRDARDVRDLQAEEQWTGPHDDPDRPLATMPKLRRTLFAYMGDLGIMERDARMAYWASLLGRPISTSNDLTFADVETMMPAILKRRRESK